MEDSFCAMAAMAIRIWSGRLELAILCLESLRPEARSSNECQASIFKPQCIVLSAEERQEVPRGAGTQIGSG